MARKKKTAPGTSLGLPADYAELLESLKARVQQAQTKAMLSVNRELIQLYWDIGREIVDRQEQAGWGQGVLERLADDLQKALPGISGFSRSNVFRMRAFYVAYRPAEAGTEIVAQLVRQSRRAKVAQPVRQLPDWSSTSRSFFWNWGPGSLSWAGKCISWSATTISTLTSCSTTSSYAAS